MKIETKFGEILFQFHPEAAPKTVAQMKKAVKEGYFDRMIWKLA
jgi:cyclophilin family peptidyl-prolyl cis-trans isomerase